MQTEKMGKNMLAVLQAIALEKLGVEALERRCSNSLDFHYLHVWSIRAALVAAWKAGYQAGAPPAE